MVFYFILISLVTISLQTFYLQITNNSIVVQSRKLSTLLGPGRWENLNFVLQRAMLFSFHYSVKVLLTRHVRTLPLLCLTSLSYPSMYHLTVWCMLCFSTVFYNLYFYTKRKPTYFYHFSNISFTHTLPPFVHVISSLRDYCIVVSINAIKNFII